MKFETKVLIILFITIVVGLSVINLMNAMYVKKLMKDGITREAELYSKLLSYNSREAYPKYMLISDKPLLKEGYSIVVFTGKHYVSIENSYLRKKLINYAVMILFWESVFVLVIFILFYYTVYKYLKREGESKDFLSILILALTHKLGNFLASQKLNIELIPDSPPKERLKSSLNVIELSYEETIKGLDLLQRASESTKEPVDISELVLSTSLLYEEKLSKLVRVRVSKGVRINTNPLYLSMLIDLLIHNSMKYSKECVYIKVLKFKGKNLLVVRNDLDKHSKGGFGMGLRIANFIAGRIGAELHIKAKRYFTVLVCL